MTTQITNKHGIKKKTTSRKDKVLNSILLLLYIAAVVICFMPYVFEMESKFETINHLPEELTTTDYVWETKSIFIAPSVFEGFEAYCILFGLFMVIVLIFIIISYKTKALYFPIFCLSTASCFVFSRMCGIVSNWVDAFKEHVDNWDREWLRDEEHRIYDYYSRSSYRTYWGAYLIATLLIIIAIFAFILSLPFIKKTVKRIKQSIKQSIEKSRENKLNRQKAFENMAHYTPTEQPMHYAKNEYFFCTKCGYKNTADSRFCKSCGQKIE